ncbi:carboxy-S-adenosyl-L-methionine synthase CmoA [Entomomonas asaccharolytica]|uniref:Carboxy-S-adenosyl-L-methionine synthase n=1 Tax=Entomomonas asaccharolytica TaxID=2785331 RepID=A0A974NHK3_9GAMM|nr:carboxy-S-adenosyl-L-methionine synthase CmoA [Entomomonas asaccharolytica]QQP86522.1 carboxy-S-adenosyl-L-methionine synthase CmoA [Entomomonas asaccharolytica]
MKKTDNIFAAALEKVPDFVFNEDVVNVFPDMIKRSVPGYPTIVENIGVIAAQYAQPYSLLYDLGCSLGAVTQALRRHVKQPECRILAIDNSAPMVQRCQEYLMAQDAMYQELVATQVIEADIVSMDWQPASVVTMNFTLQFIKPEQRLAILKNIYHILDPKGVLLLSEKIRFDQSDDQQLINELHLAFKRANGYSELEIAQKRTAIENVMKIDSLAIHQQRLYEAGFSKVTVWFQCLNFISLIALP